jgi:hypothetical protein
MKKLCYLFGILATFVLATWAQTQSVSPATTVFLNLYNATQAVVTNPAPEYVRNASPDFPRPAKAQQAWANFMAAHGNTLSSQERPLYIECVPHLNNAMSDAERGYRIRISQSSAAAQADAQGLMDQAQHELSQPQCKQAYDFASAQTKQH